MVLKKKSRIFVAAAFAFNIYDNDFKDVKLLNKNKCDCITQRKVIFFTTRRDEMILPLGRKYFSYVADNFEPNVTKSNIIIE